MKVPSLGAVVSNRLCKFLEGRSHEVECCGIIGYAGPKEAQSILCNGVSLLQNRGYDSCGVATLGKTGGLITSKFASHGTTSDAVDKLLKTVPKRHHGHTLGIAHTRWATHGSKSDENAHPHSDWKNRIALVHNGTLDNFEAIKSELQKEGVPFKSETDTEAIANLIGKYLDTGKSFQEAVKAALKRLRGTWGLVIIHKDHPNGFMVARNGSPLIIGSSMGEVIVASEPLALAEHTNQYLALNDGDVFWITTTGINHLIQGRDCRTIPQLDLETDPRPFQHWTVKEIYEQPQSLSRALNHGGRLNTASPEGVKLGGLDHHQERLQKIKRLMITGCGTSLNAGLYGQLLFKWLDCFESCEVIDASEVDASTFQGQPDSMGVLALSQSGETRDVVTALEMAETAKIKRLSIVNQVGSLIARMTDCGVYLNAGREVAVASTKAFTSQVLVVGLVSIWFAKRRKNANIPEERVQQLAEALHRLPNDVSRLLGLDSQMKKLATSLSKSKDIFLLGKGYGYPVVLEGALKIKEISYIHAEGFGGGQLKHGPFALIDEKVKTPIILLVFNDAHRPAMINAAQQVKARGARLIILTDDADSVKGLTDDIIKIPNNGPLTALGATIPLQLLAYHLATAKGIDPDKPRGLAKTVTVM